MRAIHRFSGIAVSAVALAQWSVAYVAAAVEASRAADLVGLAHARPLVGRASQRVAERTATPPTIEPCAHAVDSLCANERTEARVGVSATALGQAAIAFAGIGYTGVVGAAAGGGTVADAVAERLLLLSAESMKRHALAAAKRAGFNEIGAWAQRLHGSSAAGASGVLRIYADACAGRNMGGGADAFSVIVERLGLNSDEMRSAMAAAAADADYGSDVQSWARAVAELVGLVSRAQNTRNFVAGMRYRLRADGDPRKQTQTRASDEKSDGESDGEVRQRLDGKALASDSVSDHSRRPQTTYNMQCISHTTHNVHRWRW